MAAGPSVPPFRHPPFKAALPGFSFTAPQGWETVSFQFAETKGLIQYSSERGAHGQFGYRKVDAVPDLERIITEIHRRHLGLETSPKIRFTRHGRGGAVILAHTGTGDRFYASVFNPEARLLCEWIFPAYSAAVVEEIRPMLESFTVNAPDADDRVFYALFGLEASVPKAFSLKHVEPYPAAVTLEFVNRSGHKLNLHRWGMADVVMQGSNAVHFYHRYLYGKHLAVKQTETQAVAGHDGGTVVFKCRGKFGFDFALGPWWRGEGGVFLKQAENRLYAVEHIAPALVRERERVRTVFAAKLSERPG